MGQLVEFKARRGVAASKTYSKWQGLPFNMQEGNAVMNCIEPEAIMVMEEWNGKGVMQNLDSCREQSEEQLIEYLDGELDQVSILRLSRHIGECSACKKIIEEHKLLRGVAADMSNQEIFSKDLSIGISARLRSRLAKELDMPSLLSSD